MDFDLQYTRNRKNFIIPKVGRFKPKRINLKETSLHFSCIEEKHYLGVSPLFVMLLCIDIRVKTSNDHTLPTHYIKCINQIKEP